MKKQINKEVLKAALDYLNRGWSIIPVNQKKKPIINWKKYQDEKPTADDVNQWAERFGKGFNIAVVTGKISGLTVVDVEAGGSTEGLPPTLMQKTGGGGWHLFYQYQPGIKNKTRIRELTDIRGDGGYIILAPSSNKKGKYEWLNYDEPAPFPVHLFQAEVDKKSDWKQAAIAGVPQGKRNSTTAEICGAMLNKFKPAEWETMIWPFLEFYNQRNSPPLPPTELRSVYESIAKREAEKPREHEWRCYPKSFSELIAEVFPEKKWLVESLVPEESIVAISGFPGCYKTWLALDMAIKIAKGEKLFDKYATSKSGVLFIDEENGERLLQERLKLLSQDKDLPIYFSSYSSFQLNEKSAKEIISFCKAKNIKVVIFDSLIRIHSVDENAAVEMATVFKDMKVLAREGITSIFTHHNRKPAGGKSNPAQEMRGSSDILAAVNCHLAIKTIDNVNAIEIHQTKMRDAEAIKPFKITIIKEADKIIFQFGEEIDEYRTKIEEAKEAINGILGGRESEDTPLNKKQLLDEIQKETSAGQSTIKDAIKEMLDAGILDKRKGRKNTTFYSLNNEQSSESKDLSLKEE